MQVLHFNLILVNRQNPTIYRRDEYLLSHRGYSGFVPARLGRLSLGANKLTASGQHFGDTTCTVASRQFCCRTVSLLPHNTLRASPCLLLIAFFLQITGVKAFTRAPSEALILAYPPNPQSSCPRSAALCRSSPPPSSELRMRSSSLYL